MFIIFVQETVIKQPFFQNVTVSCVIRKGNSSIKGNVFVMRYMQITRSSVYFSLFACFFYHWYVFQIQGSLISDYLAFLFVHIQQEKSAMEGSLEELRKEVAELEQEETKMRSREVDIKHEVEKYETVLKENQQKVKHWQKEVCFY